MIIFKDIELKQQHIPVTKASVRSSPPYPWGEEAGLDQGSELVTQIPAPLLSHFIPFVIGLDFQSCIRGSVRTWFPFWEGKRGCSALREGSLKTHLALPT